MHVQDEPGQVADGEDGDGDDEEQEGDEVQDDPRFEEALPVPGGSCIFSCVEPSL